jgi:vancomycin resistance protein VanJ
MRRLWYHLLHTFLPMGALGLHVVIFVCYARRWDKLAAITIFPFWAWGLLGLGMAGFAWLLTKQRFALWVAGLWLVTVLAFSDETKPMLRAWKPAPEPGLPAPAPDGSRVLRVVSFNCKAGFFNPAAPREVIAWQPDVVLYQETAPLNVLRQVAAELYGGNPDEHAAGNFECGIITRGRIVFQKSAQGNVPNSMTVLIHFDDGRELMASSVHLSGAETDVRLYKREALYKHAVNRLARRAEMQGLVAVQTLMNGPRPALIGGDFNAPAGDAVFRLLSSAGFRDAVEASGVGWTNTYPNQAPMLRIDHQWANPRLHPVRARTVKSVHSDHRMVVCDYLMQ